MTFNGKDLESFGFAKATKFDVSYYSDFERQEITYRGLLRSYLEIPIVRKITVGAIVKDMDKYELDLRLKQISEWLYKTGEGKLMTKRDETRYYKARCIGISVPVFKGSSARFDISFECSDFRPYKSIDNTPIGEATFSSANFTFDGKHCLNDMHCIFKPSSLTAIPEVVRNAYEIAGRSGTLRYDDGLARLTEKTYTGTLYLLDPESSTNLMTEQQINERVHAIACWLINAKRAHLILDSDAGRYYEAEIITTGEISFDDWANGAIDITFTLQPYCQDIASAIIHSSLSLSASAYKDFNLSAGGDVGYTTPLVLAIKNNGSSAITDLRVKYYDEDNAEKVLRFNGNSFALGAGQTLAINSITYDATIGSTQALKFINSGDFPVVTPKGNKKIRLYSNVATTLDVTVTMNPRWL
jgi:phage-related protein